jgi:hypothetical protein
MYVKLPKFDEEIRVNCMQKYLELLIKGWAFLNSRKKAVEDLPVFMIAITGFLQACACWIIAEFFRYFFSRKEVIGGEATTIDISFGVALVSALAIIAFSIWINRGRNMSALAWFGDFLEKWQERYYEPSSISKHYNILITNAVIICKILCMAALIKEGHTFWVLYAYTISYCVFAAAIPRTGLIKGGETAEIEAFTVCAAFAIITCILHSHLIPVVIAVIGSFFLFRILLKLFVKKFESINEELVRSLSEFILCILLIAGLLLIK